MTIEDALVEPPPPEGAAYDRARELYVKFKAHLDELSHIQSHSHEGESYAVDQARKERIILQHYSAYKRLLALAAGDAAAGTAPYLMASPMSRRFDHSGRSLHLL